MQNMFLSKMAFLNQDENTFLMCEGVLKFFLFVKIICSSRIFMYVESVYLARPSGRLARSN